MQSSLSRRKTFHGDEYEAVKEGQESEPFGGALNDSVVPGKDGKLVEARNEVPSSGDVAGYEDGKADDREGVHRIAMSWGIACRA